MRRNAVVVALASVSLLSAAGSAVAAAPLGENLGSASGGGMLSARLGFYDGHKDTWVMTDTSNKTQAKALHINYSAALGQVKGAPRQFFVLGKGAPGQLTVFGSEPGESDYNPLWEEIFVVWKAGASPVLLKSDNQIDALAKAGKLTETDEHIVLNAPIIHVAT